MTAPLRVVFGLDSFEIGGTELNAVRTAERLDRSRIDLSVVTMRREGPLRSRYERAGVPIADFLIDSLFSARTVRQGLRFARWLRRERVEILHTHDAYTNVFMVPWARLAGVPTIIASRRWWYTVPRPALIRANRLAYRLAHRVLANSPSVAGLLSREEGVSPERIITIPNFVDNRAFEPLSADRASQLRAAWGLHARVAAIGIVARLDAVKRHVDLLEAFAMGRQRSSGREWRLVLVGEGRERGSIEARIDQLGLADSVVLAGMIPDTVGLFSLFDVAVLCSEAEGFPNAVVEAMAAARPVVATRVGGVVDCVVDGESGLLVPPRDPAALASAIADLVANPERSRAMGLAGQARARSRYHMDVVLGELDRVYHELSRRTSEPSLMKSHVTPAP